MAQSLRSQPDYGEVNPYLNTPPTKLKRMLDGGIDDPEKRRLVTRALNAWRLTVPGPFRGATDISLILRHGDKGADMDKFENMVLRVAARQFAAAEDVLLIDRTKPKVFKRWVVDNVDAELEYPGLYYGRFLVSPGTVKKWLRSLPDIGVARRVGRFYIDLKNAPEEKKEAVFQQLSVIGEVTEVKGKRYLYRLNKGIQTESQARFLNGLLRRQVKQAISDTASMPSLVLQTAGLPWDGTPERVTIGGVTEMSGTIDGKNVSFAWRESANAPAVFIGLDIDFESVMDVRDQAAHAQRSGDPSQLEQNYKMWQRALQLATR